MNVLFCLGAVGLAAVGPVSDEDARFFEMQVRPILVERCYRCHSGAKSSGGLLLDSKAGWQTGGDSGRPIVEGKPEESLLIRAIGYRDDAPEMPPAEAGGKLPEGERTVLAEWVRRGAPDPRITDVKIAGMNAQEARNWWSFQPVRKVTPPTVQHEELVQNEIDRFLQERLEAENLTPVAKADRRTLIRRATYDLTGLPPTPEEVAAFTNDPDPQAFSRVIDRLLESPRYGEQWGRHWLDLVRYADSLDARGIGGPGDISEAWRYRDWVVSAFNNDLPYDEFLRQQVAGDLLANSDETFDSGKLIATSVYAIGNWGNGDSDKQKVHTDIVDDQIDLTTRAFLGLTLSCARCHDHKFDPLTTRDYYAMAGFFFSSRILDRFASPTAGETPMRLALLSPTELAARTMRQERMAQIDRELQERLVPLDKVERDVAGRPGFLVRRGTDDTPSMMANFAETELSYLTFRIPPRMAAVHPGPGIPITVAWVSPVTETVQVEVKLKDGDPVGGNGIAWELRLGSKVLAGGQFDNGGESSGAAREVSIAKDELLRLVVLPRGDHGFDTTLTEFTITGSADQRWDFREAVLKDTDLPAAGWWVCRGDAPNLPQNDRDAAPLIAEKQRLADLTPPVEQTHGLADGGIPDTRWAGFHNAVVHKRGRYDQLGDDVPRGYPAILTSTVPTIEQGSGRRQLADWLTSREHPLTARVIVNRVWQHHFGEGLVRTPNNFGKLGERPSHPELLDWLAVRLMDDDWSLKSLHRLILSSAAYQREVGSTAADPDNRWLAHQRRRRLTAEELRDSLLMAGGQLDLTMRGPAVRDVSIPRRTLYLATVRSDKSSFQTLFDGASPDSIVDARNESVVAPQALWLLNSSVALTQSQRLAERVLQQPGSRDDRIQWLTQQLFQRPANETELAVGMQAIPATATVSEWEEFCQILLCSNEFAYVD